MLLRKEELLKSLRPELAALKLSRAKIVSISPEGICAHAGRAAVLISVNKPLNPLNPVSVTYTTNLYPVPPNNNLTIALADFSSHYSAQLTMFVQQDGEALSPARSMPCHNHACLQPGTRLVHIGSSADAGISCCHDPATVAATFRREWKHAYVACSRLEGMMVHTGVATICLDAARRPSCTSSADVSGIVDHTLRCC